MNIVSWRLCFSIHFLLEYGTLILVAKLEWLVSVSEILFSKQTPLSYPSPSTWNDFSHFFNLTNSLFLIQEQCELLWKAFLSVARVVEISIWTVTMLHCDYLHILFYSIVCSTVQRPIYSYIHAGSLIHRFWKHLLIIFVLKIGILYCKLLWSSIISSTQLFALKEWKEEY